MNQAAVANLEPIDVEHFTSNLERRKDIPHVSLVACMDGNVVGYGDTFLINNTPKHFGLKVQIAPEYQQLGLGQLLYQQLMDFAALHGANRIESTVQEEDIQSLNWAKKRGFTIEHHTYISTLDLANWSHDNYVAEQKRVRSLGIRFSNLGAEITGQESFRRFYDFYLPIHRDMPGMAGIPYPDYERWLYKFTKAPGYDPNGYILAIHEDRWVGYSIVSRTDKGWLNAFTGVSRDYRGRGLALPIKVAAIDYARNQGATSVYTLNHAHNDAIVKVNNKLGYHRQPGKFIVAIEKVQEALYPR